jgi:hypothetical protein
MIRDLMYPEDARKVIEGLLSGLQYDAAIAVLGKSCSMVPVQADVPDLSNGIRLGGLEEDKAVRRDSEGLLSRFSFISMVSRFETHARLLLLQRRVLEELRSPGRKMTPDRMWNILRRVNDETRSGPVIICSKLLVEHPSADLQTKMKWLEGIYKIRNCLAHRLGTVEMIDVKPAGVSLDSVKDGDTLKAVWLRLKIIVDGQEIVDFPHKPAGPGKGEFKFEEYEREWKIGDRIDITALECQAVAMSLSFLGNQVLADFEREMNAILLAPASSAAPARKVVLENPQPRTEDGVNVARDEISDPTPHFADIEFRNGDDHGVVLPVGHQWVCNASLPSWPVILISGFRRHLPCIYLCERHAVELDLRW